MRIYKIGGYTKAIGRWINVATSSETNSVSWTFDSSKEDEKGRIETDAKSISGSITLGFEKTVSKEGSFGGVTAGTESKFGVEVTVAGGFSQEITNEARKLAAKGQTIKIETTCTAPDDTKGVGLWHFVVDTYDGAFRTPTVHTVCRKGPGLWNSPPSCPWNACKDAQCTECYEGWHL